MRPTKVFLQAIETLCDNFSEAMKISLVPAILVTLLVIPVKHKYDRSSIFQLLPYSNKHYLYLPEHPILAVTVAAIFVIAAIIVSFMAYIAWHRFVLLSEAPKGWFSAFKTQHLKSYAIKAVLIGLCLLVPLVTGNVLITIIQLNGRDPLTIVQSSPPSALVVIWQIISVIITGIVIYRLSIALPAAAVGKPISLKQAWATTKGATGTAIALAFFICIFNILVSLAIPSIIGISVNLGIACVVFKTWMMTMLNVCIINTLYRCYVE